MEKDGALLGNWRKGSQAKNKKTKAKDKMIGKSRVQRAGRQRHKEDVLA